MKYLLLLLLWGYNAGAQVVGGLPTGPVPGLAASETPLDRFVFCLCPKYNQYFRVSGDMVKSYDSTGLCKHIYVATYRDTVESSCHIQGDYAIGGYGIGVPGIIHNVGVHSQNHDEKNIAEGIALVCVKCFHQTRQKIHYKHKE